MATRTFDSPPSVLPSFGKAALAMLPGAGNLPFVGGGGGDLPDLTLELPGATIDAEHLHRYREVCGFGAGAGVPSTYPQVLAFPLHMALTTDGSFPFAAIGLVHVANSITQHRPLEAGEQLAISVRATDLLPHRRGKTFVIRTDVRSGGELVWEGASTTLRMGGGGSDPKNESAAASDRQGSDPTELTPVETWNLPADLGRRYAAIAGDRNPIHLYDITAKPLGFKRAIIHGMWTKARALAALGDTPAAHQLDVKFLKPIFLPGKVEFARAGEEFGVRDAAKGAPHLAGQIRSL